VADCGLCACVCVSMQEGPDGTPVVALGDVVIGSTGHAVMVAGGWCRLSVNFATASHLLSRLTGYKVALKEEQREVGGGTYLWLITIAKSTPTMSIGIHVWTVIGTRAGVCGGYHKCMHRTGRVHAATLPLFSGSATRGSREA
jgi:hypothetical protein